MSDENLEIEATEEENGPAFYNPKALNLVASAARIVSWFVLAGFVGIVAGNYVNLQELAQGAVITEIIKQGAARSWLFTNLAIPFLTGIGLFVVLQGVGVALDLLLEIEFNTRESAK